MNLPANQSIRISLFAPYNSQVALLGSWNNWKSQPMTQDDQGWWHADVKVPDGDYDYRFQVISKSSFLLDQSVEIADPRAVEIHLGDQPTASLVVRNGQRVQTTYQWQHDDVPLPANDALVIYELHVGDFGAHVDGENHHEGTFIDVIERLDHLQSLGINAIELMPCNQFPFDYSWGYNPITPFSVATQYGTPDDLCHLVDECHGRGMRVIHDGVYNHSAEDSPLSKIDYSYWYYQENPDPPELRYGPKFDYTHYDDHHDIFPARAYIRDALVSWVELFHIDGVRFDATQPINSFDALRLFHTEMLQKATEKPFYTIAENIPEDPAITGPDGPLDAAWHFGFGQQLTATLLGKEHDGSQPFDLAALARVLDPHGEGYSGAMNVVNYLDNHDRDHIFWTLSHTGNLSEEVALQRMRLGAALLLTAPGIPMVWMGQEFGQNSEKSLDPHPLDWQLLDDASHADLFHHYQQLIALRTSTPALQSNTFEQLYADEERGLFAFKRWDDAGGIVVVLANLEPTFGGDVVIPNWPAGENWQECLNEYSPTLTDGALHDSLGESEVKIYRNG